MSLNLRLIAMVAALLAVTIGSIAVISTRVVHSEIRKIQVDQRGVAPDPAEQTLRSFYQARGSWDGVQKELDGIAQSSGSEALLFDANRRLVAATFHPARVDLSADGIVSYDTPIPGGRLREMLRGSQAIIRDSRGAIAGILFIVPRSKGKDLPSLPQRSLDRSLFLTFAVAALFGIAMAVAIARWLTVPIERLTDATRRMEQGDLAVRVDPAGGPEVAELARGFNAMAAALDRNEELRRRMVGDVAHELRAPLTNIRCELESMQDGLTSPTRERIASLHQETMHLARLVDDLQELALAEAGRLEIDPRPVAVGELARRAAAGMETRARIIAVGPEDLMVRADPTRGVQIITNLLSNAVTHSAETDEIRIAWKRAGGEAVIEVIDRGTGIPADQLPHIFERFYRVDPSRSRNTGGAGLGLSIVRQLVIAHGGRVWAESAAGEGARFSFTLPVA